MKTNLNKSNVLIYKSLMSIVWLIVFSLFLFSPAKSFAQNTCSYFTDDIWYFATGGGGIAFNTNSSGEKVAISASGESQVNASENALSVSSPGCGSSLIFYSQHDRLYNAKHEVMLDGTFTGHQSVADGLAACYIGDNKYMLFSVTHAYEEGLTMQFQYHIIDMNEDNGYGKRISTATLETTGMSESVELIPVPGTSDQYWLVYNMLSPNEIRVRKITGSSISGVIKTLPMSGHVSSPQSYMFKANSKYNMLAMAYPNASRLALFNFDTNTGDISVFRVATSPFGAAYGVEFSPNGNYVYLANWSGGQLTQYNIAGSTFSATIPYGGVNGGGLKMGPDGKIYVKRIGRYMGVIANPDTPLTAASYLADGFDLGVGVNSGGLCFSVGLTPPAICPSGLNEAPVPVDDYTTVFVGGNPYCVNVLLNDRDPNPGDESMIVNVYFQDPADASKVSFTFNPADSTICITPKPAAQEGDVIVLTYTIRDDANPIRLCADGKLTILVAEYPDNIIDEDCIIRPTATTFTISEPLLFGNSHAMSTPLVADLDGDGIPEIITPRFYTGDWSRCNGLIISNAKFNTRYEVTTVEFSIHGQSIAIADVDNNGVAEIFIQDATNGNVVCYNYNSTAHTIAAKTGFANVPGTGLPANGANGAGVERHYIIQIADMNHDGIPELIVGTNIYNARTGVLLLTTPILTGGTGFGNPHTLGRRANTAGAEYGGHYFMPVTGDVDGDGLLEIAAGGVVYYPKITNAAGQTENTYTTKSVDVAGSGIGTNIIYPDGPTVLLDFDGDGLLDVCVYGYATVPTTVAGNHRFYAWNPRTLKVIGYDNGTILTGLHASIPFAGDIDGDGYPNYCINVHGNSPAIGFISWQYNPVGTNVTNRVKRGPNRATWSETAGFSMFDFNQNGKSKIIYRNTTQFFIADGETLADISPAKTVYSGTVAEYPIVADVDGDGQAEIILTGHPTIPWGSTGHTNPIGYTFVFKTGDVSQPWAPARPVWNQWPYNPVYINKDMTVPKYSTNPATIFPGEYGTGVQPYNGFLLQVSMLDKDGVSAWVAPNVKVVPGPVYDYFAVGDSLQIRLKVTNTGSATYQAVSYISTYKDAVAAGNAIKLDSIWVQIQPGDTISKTISILNYSGLLPFNNFIVRVNDKGKASIIQMECDTTDNNSIKPTAQIYMAHPDFQTVQEFHAVVINVLANDVLPAGAISSGFNLLSAVVTPPLAGTLSANGTGPGSTLTYVNNTAAGLTNNIDSFIYEYPFYNPETGTTRPARATAYIYVLQDRAGASGCANTDYEADLNVNPANVLFKWFTLANVELIPPSGSTRIIHLNLSDTTFLIQPVISAPATVPWVRSGSFPKGRLEIHVTNTPGKIARMRWTGLINTDWHNPRNWVGVKTENGRTYETPAMWVPSLCVDVVIPSGAPNYPELIAPAFCNDILMEDRAMLKNPHVLNYRNASVELKLKPSERDRFIMWSAPLSEMVTGDYHYKGKAGEPQFGDFFMNFFQQSNPDNSGAAAQSNFTTTFGSVEQPLQLGKAFNLRVVTTSLSRDSILRFPGETDTYNGIQLGSRPGKYKFVTQGVSQNALGRFNLPVYSGLGSSYDNTGWKLIQVVNPYMAYLRADSFLLYNPALQSGYYYWNGELDGSFTTVGVSGTGNRFVYTEQSAASLPNLIAPLQSFFVAKENQNTQVSTVVMSPRWTTASPPASYTLRSMQVTSGGVLYIRAIQGSRTSSAALVYDPEATSKGDLPVFVYNEIPLTLYAFSPGREALSIRTSNDFQSRATDLGLRVMHAGEMKLEFSGLSTFGHDVYLQDKQLGKTVNLQNNPEYVFTVAKSGTNAIELNDRFSLGMAYTGKGIVTGNESAPSPAALQVSSKGGYLDVQSQGEKIDQLQIYSLTGKLI